MKTEGEVVRRGFAGGVEVVDLVVTAADDVVVANDDAGNGGEEDGVSGKVGCKIVRGREKIPVVIMVSGMPV